MYKKSMYLKAVSIQENNTQASKALVYSNRSNVLKIMDAPIWQAIEQNRIDLIADHIQEEYIRDDFIVPEDMDERALVLSENKESIAQSDSLYMAIQPSAACPFGCGYCGQKHEDKNMTQDIQTQTIERLRKKLSQGTYKHLDIAWFGGEPLVGHGIIKRLTQEIKKIAVEHNLSYDAKIVTNGLLLTPDLAKSLLEESNVTSFEITLDGDALYHDQRRHTKAGGPTFDQIYQNVKHLTTLDGAHVIIRANVDARNRDGVKPLLERLKNDNLHTKVTFYVAPIHSWGNDAHLLAAEKTTFAEWEVQWLIEMEDMGFAVNYLPKRNKTVCFTVQENNELIDPYGSVFSCSEVSLVPSYVKDGKNIHSLGTLEDAPLKHSNSPWANFYSDSVLSQYGCWTCPMLPTCGGSCPKEWGEGRIPCPSTKYNIEQRMLLAYVKSLKN